MCFKIYKLTFLQGHLFHEVIDIAGMKEISLQILCFPNNLHGAIAVG